MDITDFKRLKELVDTQSGVYWPDSEQGKKGFSFFDAIKSADLGADGDPSGDTGGLLILKTKNGEELPLIVSYMLPVIAPDFRELKELGSSAKITDVPEEIITKVKEIAIQNGYEILDLPDLEPLVKEVGMSVDDLYAKYIAF